ncbi:hypothetical protein K0M31_002701, partial [Melipona bicolor]
SKLTWVHPRQTSLPFRYCPRVSRARKASIIYEMGSNVAEGCLPVAQTTFRKQHAPGRVGSRIALSKRQSGKIVIAGKRGGKTWLVYCIVQDLNTFNGSQVLESTCVCTLRQHVLLDQHGSSEG